MEDRGDGDRLVEDRRRGEDRAKFKVGTDCQALRLAMARPVHRSSPGSRALSSRIRLNRRLEPDGKVGFGKVAFRLLDGVSSEVEDAGGEDGVGFAFFEDIDHVVQIAGAA